MAHRAPRAGTHDLRWRALLAHPAFDLATIAARLARAPSPAPATHAEPGAGDGATARAAVAAILRDAGAGAEVLLIRRAERRGDPWSGHMAFPGGRRDATDSNLHATAVRETREEVGIDLDADGALLGRLPDLEAIARARRTGLVITPFVFALARDVPLAFDAEEVAGAFWVPLSPLARGEGAGTVTWQGEGGALDLPCWRVQGQVVWGLTYRMIQSLFEALA